MLEMKHPKKAEEHIGRNVVSITMKMKIIVRIFRDKNDQVSTQKFKQTSFSALLMQSWSVHAHFNAGETSSNFSFTYVISWI